MIYFIHWNYPFLTENQLTSYFNTLCFMTAKDARLWQKQTCKRKALSSPQCYFVSVYIVAWTICNSFSFLCSNIQDEIGGKLTFSKTSYSYTYTVGIVSIPTIIVVNSPMYGWEDFQALNVEKCFTNKTSSYI